MPKAKFLSFIIIQIFEHRIKNLQRDNNITKRTAQKAVRFMFIDLVPVSLISV